MLKYPKELQKVFQKLLTQQIRPIIIGGYVRDFLLHKTSKDIDVELYGIDSYEKLEKLLQEFGRVNSVGKSFGICKLQLAEYEVDFSFPRRDSKIAQGHRGFSVEVDTTLDFKSAAKRRDFTLNAIGFDVEKQRFLDPYEGRKDLHKGILKAVDSQTFQEDPLRVLRAVQMSARFSLQLSPDLLTLCIQMVKRGVLQELPKERILEEIKKLFFRSAKISQGFFLLEKLGTFTFFTPLDTLNKQQIQNIANSLDRFTHKEANKTNLSIMFALVCYYFTKEQTEEFLAHFTTDTKLIKKVLLLIQHKEFFKHSQISDYDLYTLATKLPLEEYFLFLSAHTQEPSKVLHIKKLYKRAKKLQILKEKKPNLLQGKDLISLGLEPSKIFSHILDSAYKAQIQGKFTSKEDALKYVQKYLLP